MKNEFYKQVLQEAPFGYAHHEIIIDEAGKPCDYRFIEVNEAFEKLTGLKKENLIGSTVREVIPGIENSDFDWIGYYGKIALEGGQMEFEQFSEPLVKWYRVYVYSTLKTYFTTVFTDITSCKFAEEEAQKNLVLLNSVQRLALVGGWEWNTLRQTMTWTDETYRIHGMTPGEPAAGSPEHIHRSLECYDPADRPVIMEAFSKCAGEGKPYNLEFPLTRTDGKRIWIQTMAHAHWNGSEITRVVGTIMDITERKKSETILSESKKKYQEISTLLRLMADNMPDMLWAKNLNKEYIFTNKALCNNLLNATDTEEPLGKNDMFFASRERNSHPENPKWHTFGEICSDSDSITLKDMKPRHFDEFGNVKGEFIFLDVHKAPLFDEEGKLIGVVGSARDVTIARITEIQLRKLSQAVEQSPAGVVIANLEWVIEYVNPKFTEITGYTFEEAVGQSYYAFKPDEMPDETYKELWETITAGNEWKAEFRDKKKNGDPYWEAITVSPICSTSGTITHFLAVKEDITLRKLTEIEIERSRAELRAIYDTAPVMMAVIDKNRTLMYANPSFTAFTGIPEAELKGGRACGVFGCINAFENPQGCGFGSNCNSCKLLHSIEDSFLNGIVHKDIEYNTTLICNDKSREISLIGSTAPINFAGESLLLLNFIDISDRKHAEIQIKAKNVALSELNAQKDKFFSIIAHDLKSPFSGILGFSEILVDQMKEKDYNGIEQYAGIILQSSKRAMDLVTNLLEWARSQTGKIEFSPEFFEMVDLIKDVTLSFDYIADQKSITIKRELPHNLPTFADKSMISTVLRNLISNAVKFTRPGGEINISAKKDHKEVLVSVCDNGVGIATNRTGKLFQTQHSESTYGTANEKGTGLGLILCKEFIEKHGGRIWVESEDGKGSVFSFSIPCSVI